MTLNCIWWWGFNSADLEGLELQLITITPRFTLTQSGVPVRVLSISQVDLKKLLFISDTTMSRKKKKKKLNKLKLINYAHIDEYKVDFKCPDVNFSFYTSKYFFRQFLTIIFYID